jgi:DNA repair exonuclease SbcCD nuclease subunit
LRFVHTADTHLGFEITRVHQSHPEGRLKRADHIFHNFIKTIDHALEIEADLFIHSGDLFNKTYISREILDELIWPLFELSRRGVKTFIIPGNHEKSVFPFDLFHGAANIFVFSEPRTYVLQLNGYSIGLVGFPFIRDNSRYTFLEALKDTEYTGLRTDMNFLVTHQAFDQARVGPAGFIFRAGRRDTVSKHTVPTDFDYIAAGHIHQRQILSHPLRPDLKFVYPGSIQRISFAERFEEKGFFEGEVLNNRIETRFIPLPVYDMEMVEIESAGKGAKEIEDDICSQFWRFDPNLVIRFLLTGGSKLSDYPSVEFERLRSLMPPVLECQFAIRTKTRLVMK